MDFKEAVLWILKTLVVGLAIIILTSFVTIYGISIFYPQVEYGDYCDITKPVVYDSEQACVDGGGRWNSVAPYETMPSEKLVTGYCDTEFYCRQGYEEAMKERSNYIFYLALPLGVMIIILGAVIFGLESVGIGLMGGGIVTLIYGAGGYWQYAQNLVKFLLSLAGLIVVIYFVYWLSKRSEKKSKDKKRRR